MADPLILEDWKILGFTISAFIGILIITYLFINFVLGVQSLRVPLAKSMRYSSVIALLSGLFFCVIDAFVRTDIIFYNLDFSDPITCNITYGLAYFMYFIHKLSTYLLFTFRIEVVFQDSAYAVSRRFLQYFRLILVTFAVATIIMLFFVGTQEATTAILDIHLCTGETTQTAERDTVLFIGIIALIDFILSIILLYIFCSKLREMVREVSRMDSPSKKFTMMLHLGITVRCIFI